MLKKSQKGGGVTKMENGSVVHWGTWFRRPLRGDRSGGPIPHKTRVTPGTNVGAGPIDRWTLVSRAPVSMGQVRGAILVCGLVG